MSRAVFLSLVLFALLIAGLATLHGAMLALTFPVLLYLFYSLWRGPQSHRLEVRRELSAERVVPETPVLVKVTVTNAGEAVDELVLEDRISPALSISHGSNRHLISLSAGGSYSFEYTVHGPRGGYSFETLHAEAGDQFGVVRIVQDVRTFGKLFIFPSIVRIKQVPIRPRRTKVYAGAIPARVGGAGVEFFGVRDYQPGDSSRRINWHVSARSSEELFSNEFQQERVADVGIVLDGRERSNLFAGGSSLFEHSVLAAGTLADAFLTQGNRVGLLVYSQFIQWMLPGYGKLQRYRILHSLAQADLGSSQLFDGLQYLPTRMFPVESQIVLVSPLIEEDYSALIQLRARGYQLLIVSPDPVSFEHSKLQSGPEVDLAKRVVSMERELMLRQIRRAGIQVMTWNVTQPFDEAARRAFGPRFSMGNRL